MNSSIKDFQKNSKKMEARVVALEAKTDTIIDESLLTVKKTKTSPIQKKKQHQTEQTMQVTVKAIKMGQSAQCIGRS